MSDVLIPYKLNINKPFREEDLLNGIYIAVIHATRVPPHIGMIINKKYHSLTVKGQDINTSPEALIKNTIQRKIPSLFIKIHAHNSFSNTYLAEHLITNIQQFPRVDVGVATCLSPVKLFFEEAYNVPMRNINYLYELLPVLELYGLIENISSMFIDETKYQLPFYTDKEINEGIKQVRKEFNK